MVYTLKNYDPDEIKGLMKKNPHFILMFGSGWSKWDISSTEKTLWKGGGLWGWLGLIHWLILISSIQTADIDSLVAGSDTSVPVPGCLEQSSPRSPGSPDPANTKKQMVTL